MVKHIQENDREEEDNWGTHRENYYQNDDSEYSSQGQEEEEAHRLHAEHLAMLDNNDYYQLPNRPPTPDNAPQDPTHFTLSSSYLTKQLTQTLKMAQRLPTDHVAHHPLQAYLMALIALKQLNIPQIEHHPFLNKAIGLKQTLSQALMQDTQGAAEENVSGEKRTYAHVKKERLNHKKTKREQYRKQNKAEGFKCVGGQQARLASELILKNRGLVKKRKKIQGNSRVKLRRKYEKKLGTHKAKPGHRHQPNPGAHYQGEKNIKTNKIASVKFK